MTRRIRSKGICQLCYASDCRKKSETGCQRPLNLYFTPIRYQDSQTQAFKSKKVAIRRKLPSFFLHRQRSDKKMLMPLTQIQDGKGLIGVTTPLPNARSLFFLTSLAAISEDGTCFSLSFYSCYSFNFFPIAACLASKPYLPFAASTERLVWSIGYFLFGLVLTQILSIKRYKRRRSAAYALISFRCRKFSGID